MLASRVRDARVLDLYAGSGALGLEALSRGAAHCTFVEADRHALVALRRNLETCAVGPRARVEAGPVDRPRDLVAIDLVLADPPYDLAHPLPAWLEDPGILAADALLALETSAARVSPGTLDGWRLVRRREHGITALSVYGRPQVADEQPSI